MSTTQVITGALLAVGLFEGRKGVNIWGFIRVRHLHQLMINVNFDSALVPL